MKKKLTAFIIAINLLGLNIVNAQIAKEVLRRYPANILYRLYDVAAKTELTLGEQKQLADYFISQDNLAEKEIKNGVSPDVLAKFYTNNSTVLKPFLQQIHLNDYMTYGDVFTSQTSAVLKYRTELQLTSAQTEKLLIRLKDIGDQNTYGNIDARKNEILLLQKTLTIAQYNNYLLVINKKRALDYAESDWQRIKQFGIDDKDSLTLKKEILSYEIAKVIGIEGAYANNTRNIDSVKKYYDVNKPLILYKMAAYRQAIPASDLTGMFKYRNELKLTASQLDSLFERMNTLEHLRFEDFKKGNHYNARSYENQSLSSILDEKQLTNYLTQKDRDKAAVNASQTLTKLQTAGLITETNIKTIQKLIGDYELRMLVANDRLIVNKNQKNAFIKADIENTKPDILKQLDQSQKKTAANAAAKKNFTW